MLRGSYLVQVGVIIGASLLFLKNGRLGPDTNPEMFARICFCFQCVETPIFIVFLPNSAKQNKLGPDNNLSKDQIWTR